MVVRYQGQVHLGEYGEGETVDYLSVHCVDCGRVFLHPLYEEEVVCPGCGARRFIYQEDGRVLELKEINQ